MNTKMILLEAVKTLVEKGKFQTMTVQDILDEAEVSRATFYKYFRDKYDITNNYYVYYANKEILSRYDGHNWLFLIY